MKPFVIELIEVPLPIHSKPQPSEPESELRDLPSITVNTYFSKAINEPSLKAFIKVNPNRFSSGEDMAIFYLLMTENSYIGTSKKDFHNFISSLIDCVGYILNYPMPVQRSRRFCTINGTMRMKKWRINIKTFWKICRYLYSIKDEVFRMRLHSLRISFP